MKPTPLISWSHRISASGNLWQFCRRHQTLTNHPRKKQKHFLFLHFKHPRTLFFGVFFSLIVIPIPHSGRNRRDECLKPTSPLPTPHYFPSLCMTAVLSPLTDGGCVQSFSLRSGCRLSPLSNTNQTPKLNTRRNLQQSSWLK